MNLAELVPTFTLTAEPGRMQCCLPVLKGQTVHFGLFQVDDLRSSHGLCFTRVLD